MKVSVGLVVLVCLAPTVARAQETRFAVVDITADGRNEKVANAVEKDVGRLRPNAKPLEDASMRRLLATGEGPNAAAARLTREAEERRTAGDCAGAVDRANQAEALTLGNVPLDDERDLLRTQYVVLVACQNQLGHAKERDAAAVRLRSLVSLLPPALSQDLWDKFVAKATLPAPKTELHVDSDPPNAQIAINFHGDGVTPRTLKVPPGTVYIEVQKDGYRKAFRKLEVGNEPMRTAFRLIERTHDRLDQALSTLNLLRRTEVGQTPPTQTLARLAQLSRADFLVVLQLKGNNRVKIWFFDAERGGLSTDTIDSAVDPESGRVANLAARAGGAPPPPPAKPPTPPPPSEAKPATPTTAEAKPAAPPPETTPAQSTTESKPTTSVDLTPKPEGLPEAQAKQVQPTIVRRKKPGTPWWSWLIAGAVGATLLTYIYFDRPQHQDTLAVKAFWVPPQVSSR
jgi:hypothetical protein